MAQLCSRSSPATSSSRRSSSAASTSRPQAHPRQDSLRKPQQRTDTLLDFLLLLVLPGLWQPQRDPAAGTRGFHFPTEQAGLQEGKSLGTHSQPAAPSQPLVGWESRARTGACSALGMPILGQGCSKEPSLSPRVSVLSIPTPGPEKSTWDFLQALAHHSHTPCPEDTCPCRGLLIQAGRSRGAIPPLLTTTGHPNQTPPPFPTTPPAFGSARHRGPGTATTARGKGEDGRGSLPTGLLGNPARSLCMPRPRTACSRRVQCPPLAARCLGARWTIREGVCSCIPRTEPNSLPEPGARPSGGDGSGAPAPGSGIKAPSSAHNGRLRAGPGQLRGHVPALAAGGETPAQKGLKGDKTVLKSTAKVRQNSQKMVGGNKKKKTPPKGGSLNRKKWWKKGA